MCTASVLVSRTTPGALWIAALLSKRELALRLEPILDGTSDELRPTVAEYISAVKLYAELTADMAPQDPLAELVDALGGIEETKRALTELVHRQETIGPARPTSPTPAETPKRRGRPPKDPSPASPRRRQGRPKAGAE